MPAQDPAIALSGSRSTSYCTIKKYKTSYSLSRGQQHLRFAYTGTEDIPDDITHLIVEAIPVYSISISTSLKTFNGCTVLTDVECDKWKN
eukprot:scaffold518_cov105-Skeletonema_menzelii.AAC.4